MFVHQQLFRNRDVTLLPLFIYTHRVSGRGGVKRADSHPFDNGAPCHDYVSRISRYCKPSHTLTNHERNRIYPKKAQSKVSFIATIPIQSTSLSPHTSKLPTHKAQERACPRCLHHLISSRKIHLCSLIFLSTPSSKGKAKWKWKLWTRSLFASSIVIFLPSRLVA
jgi:hypothetical protein